MGARLGRECELDDAMLDGDAVGGRRGARGRQHAERAQVEEVRAVDDGERRARARVRRRTVGALARDKEAVAPEHEEAVHLSEKGRERGRGRARGARAECGPRAQPVFFGLCPE